MKEKCPNCGNTYKRLAMHRCQSKTIIVPQRDIPKRELKPASTVRLTGVKDIRYFGLETIVELSPDSTISGILQAPTNPLFEGRTPNATEADVLRQDISAVLVTIDDLAKDLPAFAQAMLKAIKYDLEHAVSRSFSRSIVN